jgi:catechol 2,3-dioxygenase-like lactoylglutathione lyase family enzyme
MEENLHEHIAFVRRSTPGMNVLGEEDRSLSIPAYPLMRSTKLFAVEIYDLSDFRRSPRLASCRSWQNRTVLHGASGAGTATSRRQHHVSSRGYTFVFTRCDKHQAGPYEKEKVGLNHLAFGARTLEELQAIRAQLDSLGVAHSGIKRDKYGQKEFIWLDDPDGMRIEFYRRRS